ncbi:MAG: hemolysin family protein [Lactobacillus sp.]|jgi:putative hemolysin|nr:hemolysin family protein [Lactobacillus sp.]MCI1481712.1 hemolysin family protein [Lactobacillus sp.]
MKEEPAAGGMLSRLKRRFKPVTPLKADEQLKRDFSRLWHNKSIDQHEYSMLTSVVDFQNRMAREVMVARPDAFMVDARKPLPGLLDEILRQPYSRIPVYNGDKDHIIGVIHIRTVLREARRLGFDNLTYDDVMFEPLFVPETITLAELLDEMQSTQMQLAILLDEYGGVVGLATIEDLVEEIVGQIEDEADHAEAQYKTLGNGQYLIAGRMPLVDFNEQFHQQLQEDDVDTVAGYVITKLGMIPAKGEKLRVPVGEHAFFTTQRMRGSRLLDVKYTEKTIEQDKKEVAEH